MDETQEGPEENIPMLGYFVELRVRQGSAELEEVVRICREYHRETLPWFGDGHRLLPFRRFWLFVSWMHSWESEISHLGVARDPSVDGGPREPLISVRFIQGDLATRLSEIPETS